MKWKKLTLKSKLRTGTLLLYNEFNDLLYWCIYWHYQKKITLYPINSETSREKFMIDVKEVKETSLYSYLSLPSEPKRKTSFEVLNHGINCHLDCECQKYKTGFALGYEFIEKPERLEQYIKQVGEESYP